jgi:hypothetical protein
MTIRRLTRVDAERRPELVWNTFIDILSAEDYDDLSSGQRIPHLVFWYDAEVQNGGHGQYFDNRGVSKVGETVEALRTLGLECQAAVLTAALERRQASTTRRPDAPPARGSLGRIMKWLLRTNSKAVGFADPDDAAYHRCSPTIVDALERYLATHEVEFVEFD